MRTTSCLWLLKSISACLLLVACGKVNTAIVPVEEPQDPEEVVVPETPPSVEPEIIMLSTEESKVASLGNEFGLKAFRGLSARQPDTDLLFSPLSLSLDLTLCAGGGVGQTQSQILDALGFTGVKADDVAGYYRKVTSGLSAVDPTVKFTSANSVWADVRFTLKDSYTQYASDYFGADITSLDLKKKESLTRINKWCTDKTEGLVGRVLDDSRDPEGDPASFLLNAVYFKGGWTPLYAFDEEMPQGTFHSVAGDRSATFLTAEHYYGYRETETAQFVSLSYGNGMYKLVLALPREGVSIGQMLSSLTNKDFFSGSQQDPVTVRIPKFNVDYNTEDALIPVLKDLGMSLPFDKERADFSGMFSDGPMFYIDQLFQKGTITVDEKGTEAAEVTLIGLWATSNGEPYTPVPRTFIADRPFVFALVEDSSRTILLFGQKVQ